MLVSTSVMVHCAPTITAPLASVSLPEMRAPSVCANAAALLRRRIATNKRYFIQTLRACSHASVLRSLLRHQEEHLAVEGRRSLSVLQLMIAHRRSRPRRTRRTPRGPWVQNPVTAA